MEDVPEAAPPAESSLPVVYVVEDDPVQQRLLQTILDRGGFAPKGYSSPLELVDQLSSVPLPALVLSDIHMPEMDGLVFAGRLLEDPDWCRIPVIVATAEPTRDRVAFSSQLEVPPEAFLVKPMQPSALCATATAVIQRDRPLYILRALQRERRSLRLKLQREQQLFERSAQGTVTATQECNQQLVDARKELQGLQRTKVTLQKGGPSGIEAEMVGSVDDSIRRLEESILSIKRQILTYEEERREVLARMHDQTIRSTKELRGLDERIRVLVEVIRIQSKSAGPGASNAA